MYQLSFRVCARNVVFICGPEKTLYIWEPIAGQGLPDDHPILSTFRKALSVAGCTGWRVDQISFSVQRDTYQCGIWSHWLCCRVHEYVAGNLFGSRSLGNMLKSFPGLIDCTPLSWSRQRGAGMHNGMYAQKERDRLRVLLQNVTCEPRHDSLGIGDAPDTFLGLDQILAGDDEFDPIELL